MAWLFVPGLEGSNSGSDSRLAMTTGLSLGWNGKPLLPQSFGRVWRTALSTWGLSGLTLEPSTAERGVGRWISSLLDSRVSPSLLPESEGGTTTPGTSGLTSPGSSGSAGRRGYSLRTSQGFSQPGLAMDGAPTNGSREIYLRWVSVLRRVCTQRRKWAHHTGGNGSSSWPTPTAQLGESSQTHRSGARSGELLLMGAAQMWPTATSADGERQSHTMMRGNPTLNGAAMRLWPTPRSEDKNGPGEHGEAGPDLRTAALWATPTGRDSKDGANLSEVVPTNSLLGRQAPRTPMPGDGFSQSAPTSRRQLNPRFVEWLQGWPIGWTSLEPLNSDLQVTGLSPSRQPSPSATSGDNWPSPDVQNVRSGQLRTEAKGKHAMSLHHVVARWVP